MAEVKDRDATRLIPFEYSTSQASMAWSSGTLYDPVLYLDGGVVESSPGVPYEVVSPHVGSGGRPGIRSVSRCGLHHAPRAPALQTRPCQRLIVDPDRRYVRMATVQ